MPMWLQGRNRIIVHCSQRILNDYYALVVLGVHVVLAPYTRKLERVVSGLSNALQF